ncbi:hypothetical protein PINS_up010626 [Pythium insidiosum]|nr:hypothetical protein PINS_up010626 [Pythium insidiosum]
MSRVDCIATYEFYGAIPGIPRPPQGHAYRFLFRIHRDLTLHGSIVSLDGGVRSPVDVVDGRAAPDFFASDSIRQACTATFDLVQRGSDRESDLSWRCVRCAARLSVMTGLSGGYSATDMPDNRCTGAGHFALSLNNQPPNALGLFDGSMLTPPELFSARSRGISSIRYVFEGEETVADDGCTTRKPVHMALRATANGLLLGDVNGFDVIGRWEHGHKIHLTSAATEHGCFEYNGIVEGTHFHGVWKHMYIDDIEDSDASSDGEFSLFLQSIEPASTCTPAADD